MYADQTDALNRVLYQFRRFSLSLEFPHRSTMEPRKKHVGMVERYTLSPLSAQPLNRLSP